MSGVKNLRPIVASFNLIYLNICPVHLREELKACG
jgi:hypothetical protein